MNRIILLLGASASLWLSVPMAFASSADDGFHHLRSERVDGVHRNMSVELVPFDRGGIKVELTSPTNTLEVDEHVVKLRPFPDGSHEVVARARFSGSAKLVAVLTLGGLPGSLEDEIILPKQEKEIIARVELAESEEGILVTPLENPSEVEIAIQSQLAERMVTVCEAFALLPGSDLACDGLEDAFSTVRLPIPPPGDTYLIEYEDLRPDERRQIDAYFDALPAHR